MVVVVVVVFRVEITSPLSPFPPSSSRVVDKD
jgi:hypothetical protein